MEAGKEPRAWLASTLLAAGKTPSTTKTYGSLLHNLFMKAQVDTPIDVFLNNPDTVLPFIDLTLTSEHTKATTYAALWAVTQNTQYHVKMQEASNNVRQNYVQQKQSPKQSLVTRPFSEIEHIHSSCLALFLEAASLATAVNTFITGLMTGVYPDVPPRRLMDYSEMKFRNFDPDVDNHISNGLMIFHKYKTAASDRARDITSVSLPFPPELECVLAYRATQPGDWLIASGPTGAPFSTSKLQHRLHNLFGFSVDMLRQIYVSNFHKDTPKLLAMESLASRMGHSVSAQLSFYTKY